MALCEREANPRQGYHINKKRTRRFSFYLYVGGQTTGHSPKGLGQGEQRHSSRSERKSKHDSAEVSASDGSVSGAV